MRTVIVDICEAKQSKVVVKIYINMKKVPKSRSKQRSASNKNIIIIIIIIVAQHLILTREAQSCTLSRTRPS